MKISAKKIKDNFNKIAAQFDKDAVLYLVLILAAVFFIFYKLIIPGFSDMGKNFSKLSKTKETLSQLQRKIELTKKVREQKKEEPAPSKLPVMIYKAPFEGSSLENSAAVLINTIIKKINENGTNKISSLESEEKKLKDKTGASSKKYKVLNLSIELETSYDSIQNILNEIYLMNYLVKIDLVMLKSMKKYNYKRVQAFLNLELLIEI